MIALFGAGDACADALNATGGSGMTPEQAGQLLQYSSGDDRFRIEAAPNYSEELGFSLKAAAGGYVTDNAALGLIVEYGADKREYLANGGIQLNDALSFVGTIGLLEERDDYVPGEGKDTVRQMEYGASLKGAYEAGLLSGFELNGYLANAEADSKDVETGKLLGLQLLTTADLTPMTHVKLGAGYEWLAWDNGSDTGSLAFSAEGTQQLSDRISLRASAKLGASEYVYGGGLALDLGNGRPNTNNLTLNYSYINGRDGVVDDQRVELGWTYGFGASPVDVAAADAASAGPIRPVADVVPPSSDRSLLDDVMRRPAFLPQQVIARNRSAAYGCKLKNYARIEPRGYFRKADVFSVSYGSAFAYFLPDPGVDANRLAITLDGRPSRILPVMGVIGGRPVVFYAAVVEATKAPRSLLFEATGDKLSCSVRLSRYGPAD